MESWACSEKDRLLKLRPDYIRELKGVYLDIANGSIHLRQPWNPLDGAN
jgi:hypothetical protein